MKDKELDYEQKQQQAAHSRLQLEEETECD